MARRRRKKDVDLLEALVGLLMVSTFLYVFRATQSFIISGIAAGIILGIAIAILLLLKTQRDEKLKRSGIADIDKMDGRQFEIFLGHLMRAHGYAVQVTRASGDYGADLVISRDGKKIVVQAKRHSKNIGLKAVQEVQASIAHYGAAEGWVISNRDYSEEAYTLAKSNQIRLINRDKLVEMILKLNSGSAPAPKQVIEQAPTIEKECERCGSKMVLRKGPKGEFYGCSSYPKCRNIKTI